MTATETCKALSKILSEQANWRNTIINAQRAVGMAERVADSNGDIDVRETAMGLMVQNLPSTDPRVLKFALELAVLLFYAGELLGTKTKEKETTG